MPNIIEWGDWQAAQGAVQSANKAVSGLSPAQAEAAMKFTKVTLQDGTVRYVINSTNVPQSGTQIDFNTGALDAAYEYVNAGGQTSQTGAAISSPNVTQSTNMAMTQSAGGITSVGALLSVNLPTAAAAIAPIAGVALGAGLYSLNPGFWDKISRALLPFCYEGTQLLPVVADEAGNTYFPKEAIDALRPVLAEAVSDGVVSGPDETATDDIKNFYTPYPIQVATNVTRVVFEGNFLGKYGRSPTELTKCVVESNVPFNCFFETDFIGETTLQAAVPYRVDTSNPQIVAQISYTYDGEKYVEEINWHGGYKSFNGKGITVGVYRMGYTGYVPDSPIISTPSIAKTQADPNYHELRSHAEEILWSSFYGEIETSYQEGTSSWSGIQYPLNPEGIGVVTSISSDGQLVTTNPYYPVTMPVGDPGVSPKPNEVPVPGTNPEVAPATNPWLKPNPDKTTYPEGQPESDPAKVPNPVPDTDPNLDPNANPSQQPEQDPSQYPVQSTKPGDSGTTPPPIIPVIPTLPSAATGLLHVYNPTQSQIDAFGSWLWTTFSGDLIDTISKLFNDPMDAVIGLHELYATPAVSGASTIRAGFLDSGISSNLVGSRYTTINCGSIVVQEYYQNYLDYSPYTKCYIYLPFVGIVPVLADDIIGNAVNVIYHVDSYTGCCIAVVTVAREGYSSTVYQFEGNCAVEIPITSGYQSTLMGALIGAGATALTGNPHAGIAAANMGRASLGKNDVSHSGSFGSSYGAMGAKIPYIIVKRPTQKSVVNYNQDYGFPAHKRVTIGACNGYLRAREVHVISPTATDEEKARIEELLKSGVYVQ